MAITIVRLGTARRPDEGPRLGTVRRPPRGVPKSQHAKQDWYDVWLPALAPSAELMAETNVLHGGSWPVFARRFRAELNKPDASHLLEAFAALSPHVNFSMGCYCEDEERCHRSILRAELLKRGARVR